MKPPLNSQVSFGPKPASASRAKKTPALKKSSASSTPRGRSKTPAASSVRSAKSKTTSNKTSATKRVAKSAVGSNLKKTDEEIHSILENWFTGICEDFIPNKRINLVEVGSIITKKLLNKEQLIELTVTNLNFQQFSANDNDRSTEKSRKVSPNTGGKSKSQPRRANSRTIEYGKNLRVGDLLDLTQQKKKDKANMYLIREIKIVLDFNVDPIRTPILTEKYEEDLPWVHLSFKVHPVIQLYSLAAFPNAVEALKLINETIEPDYKLDKNSIVCLFEIGGSDVDDSRLEFGDLLKSFQQVQKSFQMHVDNESIPFQSKVKQCRDQNKLSNSNNYERDYIVDFGYMKDDPSKIYTLEPLYRRTEDDNVNLARSDKKSKEIKLKITSIKKA